MAHGSLTEDHSPSLTDRLAQSAEDAALEASIARWAWDNITPVIAHMRRCNAPECAGWDPEPKIGSDAPHVTDTRDTLATRYGV